MFAGSTLSLKRKRLLFIALITFVLSVHGLSAGGEQPTDAKQAIMQVLTDQQAAWNKGDLKGFMAGYQRSNEVTFYSGDSVQKGYDAVLQRYQKRYQAEGKEMGKVTFSDINVELIGADSALVRGRWQLKTSKEMPGGLFTLIFRKTPEGWKIVHDHTSSGER